MTKEKQTELLELAKKAAIRGGGEILKVYDQDFDVIQKEDYAVAETSHFGALSGAFDHVVFGRNEPALHHYHNTYRSVLNLPPLEAVS